MYQQLRRYLPFCNFMVEITGVMFQTTVLFLDKGGVLGMRSNPTVPLINET